MRLKDAENLSYMPKTIIIIPSRLAASRLPNKPLLKINNKSIIMHVYDRAIKSQIGDVYVATCDQEIIDEVKKNNGKTIKTSAHHMTGTDRIAEALEKLKNENIDYVINLQGDEPLIDIEDIKNLNSLSIKNNSKMSTLVCKIKDKKILTSSNIVKATTIKSLENCQVSSATNFLRIINDKNKKRVYHHIGIYMYKTSILKKFVNLSQSSNEKVNKLEQLRALDNGIKIDVILANTSSIGVDTEEDYIEIKKLMEYKD